jgi:hypothetical protein
MRTMSNTDTDDLPEFTSYELDILEDKALQSDYWQSCYEFVEGYTIMGERRKSMLSEKQITWLWKIKADL